MKILVIIISLIPFAYAKLEACASGKGNLPKSVTIVNCEANEDCDFVRGKSIIGDFEFDARE